MQSDAELEQSFAKQQLGVSSTESKLLGLKWKKNIDQLAVTFPAKEPEVVTKRSVLSHLAFVFDPLGLAALIVISGKFIYRSVCDSQVPWDKELPEPLYWHVWNTKLPEQVEVPRSLATYQEEVLGIDLHAFGDTSGKGTAAAVYAVVRQAGGVTQGLVTAKARLAKKGINYTQAGTGSGSDGCQPSNTAWGSWDDDGSCSKGLLDSTSTSIDKESEKEVSWLQEISSNPIP